MNEQGAPNRAPFIPLTLLTGFLGSGKTTLLNRILTERHGEKIAVIENEFGEAGIDHERLVQGEERIVEMNNGCLCCTVRGDLIRILGELADKRDSGRLAFDRVVIETTGLADPGPVAQTFFVDESIAGRYIVDAVVTLVAGVRQLRHKFCRFWGGPPRIQAGSGGFSAKLLWGHVAYE